MGRNEDNSDIVWMSWDALNTTAEIVRIPRRTRDMVKILMATEEELGHGEDQLGHGEDQLGHGEDQSGYGEDEIGHGEDEIGHGEDELGSVG